MNTASPDPRADPPEDMLGLPSADVHVWLLRDDGSFLERSIAARPFLAPEELHRAARFRFEKDRSLFIMARAHLRQVLSRYAEPAPSDWSFQTTNAGRPHIPSGSKHHWLHFSVSHTQGLIAVAISRIPEVGVDVENMTRLVNWQELAPEALSLSEQDLLATLPEPEARARFFELWTLKEAYAKATGQGMALPFNSLSFDGLSSDPPRQAPRLVSTADPQPAAGSAPWEFHLHRPTPDHQLALAIRRAQGTGIVRWIGSDAGPNAQAG